MRNTASIEHPESVEEKLARLEREFIALSIQVSTLRSLLTDGGNARTPVTTPPVVGQRQRAPPPAPVPNPVPSPTNNQRTPVVRDRVWFIIDGPESLGVVVGLTLLRVRICKDGTNAVILRAPHNVTILLE
jgi:hypothetical protein